jgi:Ran GTPase-activating protein (RanGAP) involved in mRNA processing and transport
MLFQILQDLLPLDAKLPKDNYEVKKIIKDLSLSYEKIHACPNDCMLFWKENALDEACSVCDASRWKISKGEESEDEEGEDGESEDEVQDDTDALFMRKKKGAKILRWFPLKPRLQ